MQDIKDKENSEVSKEPIIGKFKPKRKFVSFLSALQGAKVRLLRDSAYIDGEKLSGVLEGSKFKIIICDNGTIDFEIVENTSSTLIDDSMLQRLLDSIDEMSVNGYAQKFIVSSLEFTTEDNQRCYLEVEHQKPIDVLKSIFEEEPKKIEISDKSLSFLDELFGESGEINLSQEDVEIFVESISNSSEPNDNSKGATETYLEESFRKMNEEKIKELKLRIENNEKEILRVKSEISQSESKLKSILEDNGVLETRLDSMSVADELIDWVFNVSEEQKPEDIGLSEDNKKIADKIADIAGLKKDILFKMLTDGFYKIRIAPKENFDSKEFEVDKDIISKISTMDLLGSFTYNKNGQFEYRGELNWHQIVGKMIKKGFIQEPEFDKICKSNSYDSK